MKRIAWAVCILAGLAAAKSPQLPSIDDFVATESLVYGVLPPESLGLSGVEHVEWSPTGRFLIIVQSRPRLNPAQVIDVLAGKLEPKSEKYLVVWDRTTRKLQEYGNLTSYFDEDGTVMEDWTGDSDSSAASLFTWFAGTDIAYIETSVPLSPPGPPTSLPGGAAPETALDVQRLTVLRKIDFGRGGTVTRQTLIGRKEPWSEHSVFETPTPAKLLVLQLSMLDLTPNANSRHFRSYAFTVDAAGKESTPALVGEGIVILKYFSDNGNVAVLERLWQQDAARKRETLTYDLRNGQVVVTSSPPPPMGEPDGKSPVELRWTPSATRAGTLEVKHQAVWLSAKVPDENPAALLSADANQAALTTGKDMVALLEKGVVSVRPIAVISRTTWDQIHRERAIQAAKQIGLALLLYSSDYDDYFPQSGHFAEGVVEPYAKDNAWFKKFVYRMNGQLVTSVQNPATTVLGFVPGPGGFAVVYVDGHVNWQPDRP